MRNHAKDKASVKCLWIAVVSSYNGAARTLCVFDRAKRASLLLVIDCTLHTSP